MTAGNGKPCVRCGTSDWYNNGNCLVCAKERNRRWQQENREREAELSRRWRKANREKVAETNRRWENANRDKVAANKRRWRKENPEKEAERVRRWQKANPDKVNATEHRHRTRKTKAGGSYTAEEWRALCEQYDNRCVCCGKKKKLEFDHVIPVSKGGSSDISNGQPLCRSCNASKSDKVKDYRTKPGIVRWIQRKLFG